MRQATPKHHLPMALFLGVMLIAMVQALWWVYFQVAEGARFRQLQLGVFAERVHVASQDLAQASHVYSEQERRLFCKRFPGLSLMRSDQFTAGFSPEISAETYAWVWRESGRRTRMFIYEGAFFTVLILLGVYMQLRAHRRLCCAVEQQSNFIAAVTHELKSPLTAIRLYTELLEAENLEPKQRSECAQASIHEVDRLNALVEQILKARTVDTSNLNLHLESISLLDFMQRGLLAMRARTELRGMNLDFQIEDAALPNSAYQVKGDTDALETIFGNLLDNAIKYAAGTQQIRLRLAKRGKRIELSVKDDGFGFEPSEGRRLFDRFYRSGSELTRAVPGTGLGLFLVQELAQAMNAKVFAASPGLGQGARFTVVFPSIENIGEVNG